MKFKHKIVTIVVLVMIISPSALAKTQQQEATIAGKVTDTTDHALPFVNILLLGTSCGSATNDSGYFIIKDVPPGVYTLRVSAVGYETALIDSVVVPSHNSTRFQIRLRETRVWSSANIHESIRKEAIATADSDLARGHVILISPNSITAEESTFAEKYGFQFKAKTHESILYLNTYNGIVDNYLAKRFGEKFLDELGSLWNRNHNAEK